MSTDLVKEADESEDVITHEVIRSEVNFLVFPFFALWDKDVNERTETEYIAVIQRGNKRGEIEWNVSANPKYGYPGPFDKSFHKAIEEKISQIEPPIENPICIGSLYKLAEKVGVKKIGGSFYERVNLTLVNRIEYCLNLRYNLHYYAVDYRNTRSLNDGSDRFV